MKVESLIEKIIKLIEEKLYVYGFESKSIFVLHNGIEYKITVEATGKYNYGDGYSKES